MSTDQVVQFVNTRVSVLERYLPDKFQYRHEKGWRWVQKVAFWLLSKIGCYAVEKVQSFDLITIHKQRFMENLYNQQNELFMTYVQHGKTLLIGPQDLSGLLDETVAYPGPPVQFTAEYRKGLQVLGMNIVVIPWMKGMLVLPYELPLDKAQRKAQGIERCAKEES